MVNWHFQRNEHWLDFRISKTNKLPETIVKSKFFSIFTKKKVYWIFNKRSVQNHDYDCSHLTMTFSALNSLLTLKDDFKRLDKHAIINSLKKLQINDGRWIWSKMFVDRCPHICTRENVGVWVESLKSQAMSNPTKS